jgi:hypothetical protein
VSPVLLPPEAYAVVTMSTDNNNGTVNGKALSLFMELRCFSCMDEQLRIKDTKKIHKIKTPSRRGRFLQ